MLSSAKQQIFADISLETVFLTNVDTQFLLVIITIIITIIKSIKLSLNWYKLMCKHVYTGMHCIFT